MTLLKKNITLLCGIFSIVISSLVLAGWFFDIGVFKTVLPGLVSMKFNTAAGFLLLGVALVLMAADMDQKIIMLPAALVMLLGLLTLCEYLFNWNAGIDELFWTQGQGAIATKSPGRMSLSTAINFTLISLIFLNLHKRSFHPVTQVVLVIIVTVSLQVIFNHSFGSSFLQSIPGLSNTALLTAILFIVLSAGILYSTSLQYLKFSFQKKIVAFFILTVLLLGFAFYAMEKNISKTENTDYWVEHTHLVLLESEKLFSQAKDIESAVRGFVITENKDYLAPFTSLPSLSSIIP